MLLKNSKYSIAILLLLFIISTCLFLSGCSKDKNNETNSSEGEETLVVTMPKTSEPDTGFDPIYGWACGEHVSDPLIQSTLIKADANMTITPDLATSYKISDDAKLITFYLRDGVLFSNGEKLSAYDVAYTINAAAANEANPADFSSIEVAEAIGDLACNVKLKKADNTVIYLLANVGIVPEKTYNSASYGSNPIGSGKYKLEGWDKGKSATFVANENYYGDEASIKRFQVLFLDDDASFAYAKSQSVDVAYIPAKYSNQEIENFKKLSVETVDSRGISLPTKSKSEAKQFCAGKKEYENYDLGNDVTCDFAVRYAINLALDKEQLIKNTLYGEAKSAYSVCDGLPWASESMKIECDVDEAKKVLDDAGWIQNDKDSDRSKNDVLCEFDLYYPMSDTDRQALAYAFCDQMKKIGIKVNVIGKSWDEIYAHQYSDAVLWGWGSNSPAELVSIIKSDGVCNFSLSSNANSDELIGKALSCSNLEESFTFLDEAQEMNCPQNSSSWIWLANVNHVYFVKNNLDVGEQNKHPHGHGWSLVNNIDKWSWSN